MGVFVLMSYSLKNTVIAVLHHLRTGHSFLDGLPSRYRGAGLSDKTISALLARRSARFP